MPGPRRLTRILVAAVIGVAAVVGLVVQAARGNAVVSGQSSAATVRDARLDNTYYSCLETQARSLVHPGQTVALQASPVELIALLKAVDSWATVADPSSRADVTLTLRDGPPAAGTCLGTRVAALVRVPGQGTVLRPGTGAQMPGAGPPPAPPL